MKIIEINSTSKIVKNELTLIMGFFDGIHLGHYQLLTKYKNFNVMTFKNIPGKSDEFLYNNPNRYKEISKFQPENLYVYDVCDNISGIDFIEKVLKKIQPKTIVVGTDFVFGNSKKNSIKELSSHFNIQVISRDERYSTTKIKEYIKCGKIKNANKMLVNAYSIYGTVVEGNKIGTKIGFPTINIEYNSHKMVSLFEGSYIGYFYFKNIQYKCVIFVGKSPTFDGKKKLVEVHLLGYQNRFPNVRHTDSVQVEFLEFIRKPKKFIMHNTLKMAISIDIKKAYKYFKKYLFII